MTYKIIVSPRAQKEIEDAIDYYSLKSQKAPKTFISLLKDAYRILELNPYFKLRYKNIRSMKIHKFPYSLYFTIDESDKTIRVLSCFHHKRSPSKMP